jgi:hypothetical protein
LRRGILLRRTIDLRATVFIVLPKVACSIKSNWSRCRLISVVMLCTANLNSRGTSIKNYTSIKIPCKKSRSSRRQLKSRDCWESKSKGWRR